MTDNRFVLNSAYELNRMDNEDDISAYYLANAPIQMQNVYNRVVTLLTMCVNKELSILLDNNNVPEEEFYVFVNVVYNRIVSKYQNINKKIINKLDIDETNKKDFYEYINHFVICLLSGVKYIEKKEGEKWHQCDEWNEWNTRYRKEERVRDYMKSLISTGKKYTKLTIKYKIEIPYMYVLAWDLPNLYTHFFENYEPSSRNDTSYIGLLHRNTSIELEKISDNMLDILLFGTQMDMERFEEDTIDSPIKLCKMVEFTKLLPTIDFGERVDYSHDLLQPNGWIRAKKTHELPIIKKEILQSTPLIPMKIGTEIFEPVRSFELMVRLMKEESKTKDYLESDILYLRNCIVKICELLLDWIWKGEGEFVRIEASKAEEYLTKIIKAANNVPRKNNNDNKDDYIDKLLNVIVKMWEGEQLDNITITEHHETYMEYAYFSVLKLSRNWCIHHLINSVSVDFVVFAFIISLRYLVKIDQLIMEMNRKYLYEEAKLFKFFKLGEIDYMEYNISEIEKEYTLLYHNVSKKAFENKNKSWSKKDFPQSENIRDPHKVLTTAGHKNSLIKKQMTEYEIFLAFWLAIHMGKADNKTMKLPESTDINILALLNRVYEYQKKSFLLNSDEVYSVNT